MIENETGRIIPCLWMVYITLTPPPKKKSIDLNPKQERELGRPRPQMLIIPVLLIVDINIFQNYYHLNRRKSRIVSMSLSTFFQYWNRRWTRFM